jgi:dTDP-4-dehydrorhamnose reductase
VKLLLLGGSGRVGWELQRALAPLGEVVAPGRDRVDLAQPQTLGACVRALAPDVIVNAAAYTAVDRAESETACADAVNADAPGELARAAARAGAVLVHYGTDQVFDGRAVAPYLEDDLPAPPNAYGRSKLEGERRVRAAGGCHLILRTTWVYAPRGPSFARLMLERAAGDAPIRVVADEVGAPTPASLVADVTAHALRALARDPRLSGLYHCVAGGAVSRFDHAAFLLAQAQARGWTLRQGPGDLLPVRSAEFPAAAVRPLNACLDNRRLQQAFGLRLPPWQEGVLRLLDEWGAAGHRGAPP